MTTPTAPVPHPIDADDQEQQRNELAMLDGHDADIHTTERTGQTSPSPADTESIKAKDEEAGRISIEGKLGGDRNEHEGEPAQAEDNDPNVVSWEGSDDPENPVNWKESLKWGNVAAISAITFITYVPLIFAYIEDLGSDLPSVQIRSWKSR